MYDKRNAQYFFFFFHITIYNLKYYNLKSFIYIYIYIYTCLHVAHSYIFCARLGRAETCVSALRFHAFFFFFFSLCKWTVKALCRGQKILFTHCSRTVLALFMGPTILFTHLKIILLQCFQFSVFSFQFQQQ